MRYAACVQAFARPNSQQVSAHLTLGYVEASSDAEAEGIAWRECHRIYPQTKGWSTHWVSVHVAENLNELAKFKVREGGAA